MRMTNFFFNNFAYVLSEIVYLISLLRAIRKVNFIRKLFFKRFI